MSVLTFLKLTTFLTFHHSRNSHLNSNHLKLVVPKMYDTWCLSVSPDIPNIPDISKFPLLMKLQTFPIYYHAKSGGPSSKIGQVIAILIIPKKSDTGPTASACFWNLPLAQIYLKYVASQINSISGTPGS